MAGSRLIVRMNKPHMHPYLCARCNVGDEASREFFLDIGVNYDFEGNVYLCNKCLEDIVKAAGSFFTKDEVDEIISVQSEMVQQASEIKNDWSALTGYLHTFGIDLEHIRKIFNEREVTESVGSVSRTDNPKTDGANGQVIKLSGVLGS